MKIERDYIKWCDSYNSQTVIDTDDIRMIVKYLNKKFNMNVKIVFTNKSKGFARYRSQSIHLPLKHKKFVVLHEFAHIYDNQKLYGRGHGKSFYKALKTIVNEYYGNIHDYPWICEYKSIYNMYIKEYHILDF